ncbi:hypothetical protein D3C78_1582950 [compost metagenome]
MAREQDEVDFDVALLVVEARQHHVGEQQGIVRQMPERARDGLLELVDGVTRDDDLGHGRASPFGVESLPFLPQTDASYQEPHESAIVT